MQTRGADQFKRTQKLRRAAAGLLEQLPEHLKNSPEAGLLGTVAGRKVFNIIHLILLMKGIRSRAIDQLSFRNDIFRVLLFHAERREAIIVEGRPAL